MRCAQRADAERNLTRTVRHARGWGHVRVTNVRGRPRTARCRRGWHTESPAKAAHLLKVMCAAFVRPILCIIVPLPNITGRYTVCMRW